MAITIDISSIAKSADGIRYSAYRAGDAPVGVTYTPLFTEDFEGGVSGNAYTTGTWKASTFDNVRASTGSQSMKLVVEQGQPPATCGGDTFFGGSINTAVNIPVGKTIWFRAKFYFPSTFSWGYNYSTGDSADAAACSKSADGSGVLKFMRLDPVTGTSRIYLQPPVSRRSVSQPASNVMKLTSEVGPLISDIDDANGKIQLDQWIDMQIAVKVADDGTGFIRYWNGTNFIGEVTGQTVSAGNALHNFGIGTYWNGTPYTDGGANRDEFWMDEIIVATDVSGYGAPNTVDSSGRPYIAPSTVVGDFS